VSARDCLAIREGRRQTAEDLQDCLTELFCSRGISESIRSDNGSEFTSRRIRRWLGELGTRTPFIEPGIPWEKGYIERINGKLRDELLKREIFYTLQEGQVPIERWRQE
jgi:transposase InsO family protein